MKKNKLKPLTTRSPEDLMIQREYSEWVEFDERRIIEESKYMFEEDTVALVSQSIFGIEDDENEN